MADAVMVDDPAAERTVAAPVKAGSDSGRPLFLVGERDHLLYPLDPEQIDYVESDGNYVRYHSANGYYIARESIKRLVTLLAPRGFIRIERSLLLNIRAVAYAQPVGHGTFAFKLVSGTTLRSGAVYRDDILLTLPLRRRESPRLQRGASWSRAEP
jgi:two-component system, LytTR family, response regulator